MEKLSREDETIKSLSQYLRTSIQEIRQLRHQNEVMSARLEIFEWIMGAFKAPNTLEKGMRQDPIWSAEKFLESLKDEQEQEERAKHKKYPLGPENMQEEPITDKWILDQGFKIIEDYPDSTKWEKGDIWVYTNDNAGGAYRIWNKKHKPSGATIVKSKKWFCDIANEILQLQYTPFISDIVEGKEKNAKTEDEYRKTHGNIND